MAPSSLFSVIAIALVLTLACHPTSARREKLHHREKYDDNDSLHYLCERTRKPKICRNIMKLDTSRLDDKDPKSVALAVIDLARAKAEEIRRNLVQYHEDSKNAELKEKYKSCSKNYRDGVRSLKVVRETVVSGEFRDVRVRINNALDELKHCRREFDKKSFDPAHIRNRNREFGVYLDMVKVAADRLLGENEGDYVMTFDNVNEEDY